MPLPDLLKEAERAMVICNACRYCEGYCAVFPAMELRRTFSEQDLKYLANLCHDCRGCYYACQYAPPHEFDLNLPKIFSELRMETYREFTWPPMLDALFRRNGWWVALIGLASVLAVLLLTLLFQERSALFGIHVGENAFYRVIPYSTMILSFSALALFVIVSLWKGAVCMWHKTGGKSAEMLDRRANLQALGDALKLRYLDGGGYGCNYPDDRFSMVRRYFHHGVFYGFLLCLASTAVAACYDHFLHLPAPYPIWSAPVVLGTVGGFALLSGTGGLLYLKCYMHRELIHAQAMEMDVTFTLLLFLVSLSGLLLLALRETSAMGILLVLHLGLVVGFFLTIPYGKLIHAVYRYLALVRYAIEQGKDGA